MDEKVIEKIRDALVWFGESPKLVDHCDLCEDGSVWFGLTQILAKGTLFLTFDGSEYIVEVNQ